jgi:hypothetical protein
MEETIVLDEEEQLKFLKHELQETTIPTAEACTNSNLMATICSELCDSNSAIKSPQCMVRFLEKMRQEIRSLDDRLQVLCILDSTLQVRRLPSDTTRASSNALTICSFFEQERGYVTLVEWCSETCSYTDQRKLLFTEKCLKVLLQNPPKRPFARKILLTPLQEMQIHVKNEKNKELVKEILLHLTSSDSSP